MRRRLAVALLALSLPASAATRTWTGATNNLWSVASNWQEGVVPANGDDLVFPGVATSLTNTNDLVGLSVASFSLDGSGYSISGNAITLGPGGFVATGACCSVVGLPVTIASTTAFQVVAPQAIDWLGTVSGSGGIAKSGNGTLWLQTTSDYTGPTLVSAGTLVSNALNALGSPVSGTTVAPGACLRVSGAVGAEPVALQGPGVPGALWAVGTVTMAGPITVAADADIAASGTTAAFQGPFSGPGQLTVRSSGAVVFLTGSSPGWVSTLHLESGGLEVSGFFPAMDVTFDASAAERALAGAGRVGFVLGGAPHKLMPGAFGAPAGTLTTMGVALSAADTFEVQIGGTTPGTQYDRLEANGDVLLNGATLSVGLLYAPAVGDAFTIITTTAGIGGTFAGLPQGATFVAGGRMLQIAYNPASVVLTVVSLTPVELSRFDAE